LNACAAGGGRVRDGFAWRGKRVGGAEASRIYRPIGYVAAAAACNKHEQHTQRRVDYLRAWWRGDAARPH
jgi:hypothetical protein